MLLPVALAAVTCVGDSITAGDGTSNPSTKSYPAQLAAQLGDAVQNDGHSGATLLHDGDLPYASTADYVAATATSSSCSARTTRRARTSRTAFTRTTSPDAGRASTPAAAPAPAPTNAPLTASSTVTDAGASSTNAGPIGGGGCNTGAGQGSLFAAATFLALLRGRARAITRQA